MQRVREENLNNERISMNKWITENGLTESRDGSGKCPVTLSKYRRVGGLGSANLLHFLSTTARMASYYLSSFLEQAGILLPKKS